MNVTELAPPMPTTIGPYRVIDVLGQGGMGVVYSAQHLETGRRVAIKTVRAPTPHRLASIRQEIAALRRIRHPGVVEIVDDGISAGDPWYAMERLEGETLADRNRALWGPLPNPAAATAKTVTELAETRGLVDAWGLAGPPCSQAGDAPGAASSVAAAGKLVEVLTLYRRLCVPLAFLHRSGVVHRDLKPANVFLLDGDRPVVMDFGLIARSYGAVGRESLEVVGRLRGSMPYVAPEIVRGQIPDARADLYALGCMLYESLTGVPPFQASTPAALAEKHSSAHPTRPSVRVAGMPRQLDELVMKLLAKRPQERVGHAEDVAEALLALGARHEGVEPAQEIARGSAYLFRPQLVGRDDPLFDVLRLCERARAGTGAFVLLRGESGIGKTFLASEIAQRAALKGLRVVTGECVPVAATDAAFGELGGAPLHPFRPMLQALGDRCRELGQSGIDWLGGTRLKLLSPFEPSLALLARADASPEPAPLPAAAAAERLLTALREALGLLCAESPVLLVLDDLQWADDLSLALLDSLCESFFEKTAMLVLGTFRTEEASEVLRRMAGKPWVRKVNLGRLEKSGVAAMVSEMLAIASPPETLVTFVYEHAEGIPFFVAEYLRAATAEGLLTRRSGRWGLGTDGREVATAFSAVSFPTSLAGLVRRRLDGLPADARAALEGAAVLGREFEAPLLSALTGSSQAELLGCLSQMVTGQVVEQTEGGRYRFLHDKIRETALSGLRLARRQGLHRAAAYAIQAQCAASPEGEERYPELAHHFRAAGEAMSAISYLEKAGEHALRFSAHGDAVRYFKEALELEEKLPERIDPIRRASWERQLGDAFQGLGQMAESAEPLRHAAALLGWPLPSSKAALTLALLPKMVRQALHRLLPSFLVGRRAHRSDAFREAGRVFDRMQRLFYYTGQDLQLFFANLNTLNLSERALPTPELAMAYGNAGAVAGIVPAPRLAFLYFRLGLETLERAPDAAVESYVRMLYGLQLLAAGKRSESTEQIERAIELAQKTGFERRRDECLAVRAAIELDQGSHRTALPWIEQLQSSSSSRGDLHMLSWALLQRTQCAMLQNAFDEARTLLTRAQRLHPSLGRPEKIWTLGLLSYVLYCSGDERAARAHADHASDLIAQGPPVHSYCLAAYACVAEVRVGLCRNDRARSFLRTSPGRDDAGLKKAARDACRTLRRAARFFPIAEPTAMLHEGMRQWTNGNHEAAALAWTRGLEAAKRMASAYDEARLSLALGRALPPTSPARRDLLRRATEQLSALGIPMPRDEHVALSQPNRSRT